MPQATPSPDASDSAATRILLVEDDPGFQLLIQRILERMDQPATVETSEDGPSALRRIAESAFDLVLLDYSLPGKSGLDVLRELQSEGSRVPVVMVTGMGNETVAVDALKLGAHDYLVKSGDLKTALPLVVRRVIDKVRLEDGLRRFSEENERLRELDRLKSLFIANVSHELRTPLVSVAGYTEMLLSQHLGSLTPEQRRALQVCARNTERLKILIDNILNLSSLEAHKVKPMKRPFDLSALVHERAAALRPACEARGLTLELPPDREPVWVVADPDLIEQVLWNLLGNAMKFTPDGGRVEVRLLPQPEAGHVVVEVSDTGCGIAEEHLPRVFDRFWQADSSPTRTFPGLGIGLAIVKEILDAHEATAHVRSRLHEGSTFSFDLAAGTGAEVPALADGVESLGRKGPQGDRVILVVDDEADTREYVKTALEMAGHRVLLAEGGKEALQILRGATVHLVLLDIAMRDMSGLDVLREIRRRDDWRDLPVLLLTAISDRVIKDQGLAEGATGLIEKPLRTSTLLHSIEAHIGTPRPPL